MNALEDRLRRELPALASALVEAKDDPRRTGVTTLGSDSVTASSVVKRRTTAWLSVAAATMLVVAGVVGLVSIDRKRPETLVSSIEAPMVLASSGDEPGTDDSPIDDRPVTSAVESPIATDVLNVDGETVRSCDTFRRGVWGAVSTAEIPFTIRSGLTVAGGTWVSVDDAMNRRIAGECQDSEALGDGAVEAQLAWPIGDDVYVASIWPSRNDSDPIPGWFNSIGRYSVTPLRSIAVIGRITPDVELPNVPDIASAAVERERQLIGKIEQVRDLRNYVSSLGVVDGGADASGTSASVTAVPFVRDGSAEEICTAAGIETNPADHERDGVVVHDETSTIDGVDTRWLICTGDSASGWGVTALVSDDEVNWKLSPLGLGNSTHAGDTTEVVALDSANATVHYESLVGGRSSNATTIDGGATWRIDTVVT
jgi:hypothetical protein